MGPFSFSDSIDLFHERASEHRNLTDFGADDYREALAILCNSLDEDASLTATGELALQAMITDALEARLLCEDGWRLQPEAATTRIDSPLIIIGLPRTGTTALHHLLGQDPTMQTLEHWMQRTPKPRPARTAWPTDPDFMASAARVDAMFARSPEMRAIHEIEAHLPDECWNTFSQNFLHSSYEANADVAQYAKWWSTADMRPVYRRHKRNAQLIGLNNKDQSWVFKDATHLFSLDALLHVYPDARIVQTHRDPVPVIASVCSLCSSAREAMNQQHDVDAFGRSTLALWERSIQAMMDVRSQFDDRQFFDLPFEKIVRDPIDAIQQIYAYFGIDYTEGADEAMKRFRAANPKGKHGTHRYTLEQWGLNADEVRERFQRYSEAYL